MNSDVYSRIEAAGIYGVRRVDLRKEFGDGVDKHVEELISSGLVFSDKKSGAITYWTRDNYIKYVVENDPKFRLIQVMINNAGSNHGLHDAIEEKVVKRVSSMIDERMGDLNRYIDDNISLIKSSSSAFHASMMQEIVTVKEELNNRLVLLNKAMEERISSINSDLNLKIESVRNELNTSIGRVEEKINSLVESTVADRDGVVSKSISEMKSVIDENIIALREEMDKRLHNLHLDVEMKISLLRDDLSSRMIRIDEGIHDELARMKDEVNSSVSSLSDQVKAISNRLDEVKSSLSHIGNGSSNGNGTCKMNSVKESIALEQFRIDFDRMLAESSSSIGWVELVSIKERMCRKYGITAPEFYSLVERLLEHYSSRYELSSGGQEGIVIRGLVHGFVRRI